MSSTRVLTGITTSGTPHLGNYVGAIRPAIAASRAPGTESFYFLADYHSLIKAQDPARTQRSTLEIAAAWPGATACPPPCRGGHGRSGGVVSVGRRGGLASWNQFRTQNHRCRDAPGCPPRVRARPGEAGTVKAIQNLDLLVVCDTLPSEMAGWADVILPDTTFLERHDELLTGFGN